MLDEINDISLMLGFDMDTRMKPERIILANYFSLHVSSFGRSINNARNFEISHHKGQIDSAILAEYAAMNLPVSESAVYDFSLL